jgi:hypothetical protein
MNKIDLRSPSKFLRATVARGVGPTRAAVDPVDPQGGDSGAGIIRNMAILTRGEAIGHCLWCDSTMLEQTANAINNAGAQGVKARFTHPDMSGDGLGKMTGRVKNAYVDGDVVRGDLHFSESAHKTPDGDLAGYLLALAKEDPGSFGNSIAFEADGQAELDFMLANGAEYDEATGYLSFENWKSPDPENKNNFPHARVGKLQAVDAVDDPAANPNGLFHQTHIAQDAEKLCAFALGLSDERPTTLSFDAHPDRIRGFIARFLSRHNLTLSQGDQAMSLSVTPDELQQQLTEHFKGLKPSKNLAANKEDRVKQNERAAQDSGDADKEVGDDKGEKTPKGANYSSASETQKFDAEYGDSEKNKGLPQKNTPLSSDEDDEDEAMGAGCGGKQKMAADGQPTELATGGAAPGGTAAGDEVSRQAQYQDDEDEKAKRSKAPANKGTTVESPGDVPGAVGPLGDASHNVGYSARDEAKRFKSSFGADGLEWFAEGLSYEEAQARFNKQTREKLEQLQAENAQLKEKLSSKRGLQEPLSLLPEVPKNELASKTQNGISKFSAGLAEQLSKRGNLN